VIFNICGEQPTCIFVLVIDSLGAALQWAKILHARLLVEDLFDFVEILDLLVSVIQIILGLL